MESVLNECMTMCNISSSQIFMTTYNRRPHNILYYLQLTSCLLLPPALQMQCRLILHLILMIVGGWFGDPQWCSIYFIVISDFLCWWKMVCIGFFYASTLDFSFTILFRWKYKMFCWQAPGGSCNNFHVSLWYIFSQKIRIRRQGAGNTFQFSGDYWFLVQSKYIGQGGAGTGSRQVGVCICICLISLIYCWSQ